MISIVTAYYNRKKLFYNTLLSIRNSSVKDIEVIAVDDGSTDDNRLEDFQHEFKFLRVIRLEPADKWYTNPCIPFNIGFQHAAGDIIIIQNPECIHAGDILNYVEKNLKQNDYFNFCCYSLDKSTTAGINDEVSGDENLLIKIIIKQKRVEFDGDDGWYNHPVFRPQGYHFCSALFKSDLYDLGGFDERYAMGIGFDDDEFVYRVKKKLNFKYIENPFVLHQNHYFPDKTIFSKSELILKNTLKEKYLTNRNILENITYKEKGWQVNKLEKWGEGHTTKYHELGLAKNQKGKVIKFIERYCFLVLNKISKM